MNEMANTKQTLEMILDAAYTDFLQTDSPELLDLSDRIADKILQYSKPDKTRIQTDLSDLMCKCEDIAFRSGFMACVSVVQALTGKER